MRSLYPCKVCNGTRVHRERPCQFCDANGRARHWCRHCAEALPLCRCFGQYREVVR